MNKEEIIGMLTHYYEIDLENCLVTHEMWVEEIAEALTNKNYLASMVKEYEEYCDEINA